MRRAICRGWPTGALDVLNRPGNRRYLTGYEEGQLLEVRFHMLILSLEWMTKQFGKPDTLLQMVMRTLGWPIGLVVWLRGGERTDRTSGQVFSFTY